MINVSYKIYEEKEINFYQFSKQMNIQRKEKWGFFFSMFLTPVENIMAFDWLRFDRPHAPAIEEYFNKLIRKSWRYWNIKTEMMKEVATIYK